jgi:hypothetical protein
VLAFADESYRAASPGLFVLAAACVEQDADLDFLRHELRSVRANGKAAFHWRDEDEPLRLAMLDLLASVGLADMTAVVASPLRPRRQERARAVCMRRLGWDLPQLGVNHLVIESRSNQDAADGRVLGGLQEIGELPRSFT